MDLTTAITIDPDEAAEQLAAYRTIAAPSEEDRAITAALVALCAGKQLVNLNEIIRAGGTFDDGCPRLAVMATAQAWCYVSRTTNGDITYRGTPHTNASGLRFTIPEFPAMPRDELERANLIHWNWGGRQRRTQVPLVPPQHRVRGWKTRCLILWEVEEWATITVPRPPGDPALLRHVIDDLYSVEAVWDLTPLEQLVLGARR